MKSIKKLTAAVLAASMLTVFAGCGDQSWSYKTNNASLSAGTYIYNLMNGYYKAREMVESPDEAKNILAEEVEDSDTGSKKTVEQYALDDADTETTKMIAVEDIFKTANLELNESDYEMAKSYTSSLWGNVKTTFEGYGISQESFNYCYAEYTVKYSQVFEYIYGEDGEKAVSEEELDKYYKDNYITYAYFSLSMADYDEEYNATVKSDEEFEKADKLFPQYADMINGKGKSYEETVKQYVADYELTTDPTYSGSVEKDDDSSSIPADIINAINELEEGKAKFVKSGEDENTMYYFVYKPKASEIKDYLEDSTDSSVVATYDVASASTSDTPDEEVEINALKSGFTRSQLLKVMKEDEYEDYLLEYAKSANVQKNSDVVGKFKPKMFVD